MSDQNDTIDRPPAAWLAELEAHIWAIRPEVLGSLIRLARAGTPAETAIAAVDTEAADAARRRGRPPNIQGNIAKVNLKGILMPGGGSLLAMLFGMKSPLEAFQDGFQEAMGSDEVGCVLIDVDSPGGVTDGIPEAAKMVRDARGKGKPIVAHVNTMACSAAYWIASQADEIVSSPSGVAGSIGVYAAHRDVSKMMDEVGIKTTLISAGKYKVTGNPFEPLSDEARGQIQEDVDYYYDLFTQEVALGRGVKQSEVKAGYGEGRALPAEPAKAVKLVDRVETMTETIGRLSSRSRPSLSPSADASAGADTTVDDAEANAGADEDEHAHLLARLEGHALLQDRAAQKMQPAA